MTVTLVTIPDVELVSTGTYQLASGETTFSTEDLADAVQAASDPTIVVPRLKLGHNDPRFDEAIASGELDGEPAFGTIENLRLSDDGQTIIGDFCNVPEWLAAALPSSYPGRSIEGGFGVTAASGRQYRLVITACALLGVTWPGVTSLADLREIMEENGSPSASTEQVEAEADRYVIARIRRPAETEPSPEPSPDVAAGLDLGNVARQFCGDLDDGEVPGVPQDQPQADDVGPQIWWWPRSVRVEDDGSLYLIVDDDEGHLIRIPFTVQQADLIYGQPELVIETYVPVTSDPDDGVAAGRARGPRVLASWPVRAASRPSNTTEVTTMDVDAAVLRTRLGLPEDADDAAIQEALAASPSTETEETTAAAAAAPEIPEGMALVDQETLSTLRQGAEQGAAVAARLARQDRDEFIAAAIKAGKFPAARRAHYEQLWTADEEGARELIAKLAPGVVPAGGQELGRGGDGDSVENADSDHEAFMAKHYPQIARRGGHDRRVNVRQEV
jgi:hypothetical protein